MKKKSILILFFIFSLIFTDSVKGKYLLIIGTYRQGPGRRPEVSGITSPSLHSIPMKDLETCNMAGEKITNEISTTAGYEFNKNNSVLATSGNNKFKFDIKQQGFAWMTSNKKEKIMVRVMKKGSRIMVTGYNEKGSQTIDHYSLLGFTKAYNTAKKACS